MNNWNKFKIEMSQEEFVENLEQSIEGGKFLGVGKHEVKIMSVEGMTSSKNQPYISVTYEDESGASTKDSVFFTYVDKKTGEPKYSYKYREFVKSVVKDPSLRYQFFGIMVPENPELLAGLAGLKIGIEIVPAVKGATIQEAGAGVYKITELSTPGVEIQLADNVQNAFSSYREASEVIKAQKIRRAWNELKTFHLLESEVDKNEGVVKKLMSGDEKKETKRLKLSL